MSAERIDTTNLWKQRMEGFTLLDDNVLLYKNPPTLTRQDYEEAFEITKRMILKYKCQYIICELQQIAPEFDKARAGIERFLPRIASLVECMAFVVTNPKKWQEIKDVFETTGVYLDCKVVVVGSQEEALNIFHDMDSEE